MSEHSCSTREPTPAESNITVKSRSTTNSDQTAVTTKTDRSNKKSVQKEISAKLTARFKRGNSAYRNLDDGDLISSSDDEFKTKASTLDAIGENEHNDTIPGSPHHEKKRRRTEKIHDKIKDFKDSAAKEVGDTAKKIGQEVTSVTQKVSQEVGQVGQRISQKLSHQSKGTPKMKADKRYSGKPLVEEVESSDEEFDIEKVKEQIKPVKTEKKIEKKDKISKQVSIIPLVEEKRERPRSILKRKEDKECEDTEKSPRNSVIEIHRNDTIRASSKSTWSFATQTTESFHHRQWWKHPRLLSNKKVIATSVVMACVGSSLVAIGFGLSMTGWGFGFALMGLFGLLLSVPAVYYLFAIYAILKQLPNYRTYNLPMFD